MQRKSWFIRGLSMVLCVTTMAVTLPMSTGAQKSAVEKIPIADSEIVREATEFRDETTKVFEKSDGSFVAVTNGQPLHYRDENDTWQDLDNTLVSSTNEEGETILTNKAAAVTVEIPEQITNDKEVKVSKDGTSIAFRLVTKTNHNKRKVQNGKRNNKQPVDFTKQASSVQYGGVFDDTDVAYDIQPHGVKESIILRKRPKKAPIYTYEITADNLDARLLEDNHIEFYPADSDEPSFVMPAPFMVDSGDAPAYSDDIQVTLNKTRDGVYTLTYAPSIEWLQNADRAYPVTIDPSVQEQRRPSFMSTYVSKNSPTTNYGSLSTMNVSYSSSNQEYAYIQIDMPTLTNLYITRAILYFDVLSFSGNNAQLTASPLSSAWNYSTVTWNGKPSPGNAVDAVKINQTGPTCTDITILCRNWQANGGNYGIQLAANYNTSCQIASSAGTVNADDCPYMIIEYTTASGLDPTYDMHTFDAGRAGTVYVNDYTGSLLYKRTDMDFGGNVLPVDMEYLYDSGMNLTFDWQNSSGVKKAKHTFKYFLTAWGYVPPMGEKATFNCTLLDTQGVRRILRPDEDTPSLWTDDDGYELSLVEPKVGNVYANDFKLKTPDGLEVYFDNMGVPVRVVDTKNPQKPEITLTGSCSTGITIKDGADNKYVLKTQNS